MSLSQLSCPSFSMVMTSNGQEIVRLYDTYPARHRHVRFAITLKPEASTSGAMQPGSNEFLRRIDTRFEGTMAYNVVYRTITWTMLKKTKKKARMKFPTRRLSNLLRTSEKRL
ncbi:hypothetical protein FA15DRAFT_458200 [Coprinopsis marcescibilis]|uniref:Uncharacterized protein n=1 Tax=Coprinopsis marcescibilis TaxID=230819 RepID=A0A5C3L8G3_COPMA|nr:hypothetical protein FA15DRAFT_458200 [Coprinopsis marcescibilis]